MYKERAIEFLKSKGLIKEGNSTFKIIPSNDTIYLLEELMSEFVCYVGDTAKKQLEDTVLKAEEEYRKTHQIEIVIPTNLDEATESLLTHFTYDDVYEFIRMPEDEAVIKHHHGTGTNIRNHWGLWDEKSTLNKYFNSIGIHHADDMSSIILTTFHRKLLGVPIDLEGQVKYYQDFWAKN